MGGSAVAGAADDVLEQARELAAELLEAAADDIELDRRRRVRRGRRPAARRDLGAAGRARRRARGRQLHAALDFHQDGATFPFGAHVAVVEVDTETGRVTPLRHVAVDDCGRILNPLLVAGQQHGGLAQGMAQALYEEIVYDADGNAADRDAGRLRDAERGRAAAFETANTETPTPLNPLGAKGIGESAPIGSTPAVQNAVVDALRPLGVRHLDLPCTPERVWRAIKAAIASLARAAGGVRRGTRQRRGARDRRSLTALPSTRGCPDPRLPLSRSGDSACRTATWSPSTAST